MTSKEITHIEASHLKCSQCFILFNSSKSRFIYLGVADGKGARMPTSPSQVGSSSTEVRRWDVEM